MLYYYIILYFNYHDVTVCAVQVRSAIFFGSKRKYIIPFFAACKKKYFHTNSADQDIGVPTPIIIITNFLTETLAFQTRQFQSYSDLATAEHPPMDRHPMIVLYFANTCHAAFSYVVRVFAVTYNISFRPKSINATLIQ